MKNAVSVLFLMRASEQRMESNMTTENVVKQGMDKIKWEILQSVAGKVMRTAWVLS